MAVLLDFLLQVTAFVALIVYDFRRAEDGRIDCVPCARLSSSAVAGDSKCPNKFSCMVCKVL
jgi:Niemann-Pick C1 protein